MKNCKTTLTGLVLAAMIAIQPLATDGLDLNKDWFKFVIAIGIAVFGYFAKDHDVTGV